MYHMSSGIPSRVHGHMCYEVPLGVLQVIDEICHAFISFSNWETEREPLPVNWRHLRSEIENNCPLRHRLMNLLNEEFLNTVQTT